SPGLTPCFKPRKPLKLPALRAVVTGRMTPGLYPAFRRRKLHISHFRPKGRKLAHSTAPPLPTEPACAGLRRGPHLVLRRASKAAQFPFQSPRWGRAFPCPAIGHTPPHSGRGR